MNARQKAKKLKKKIDTLKSDNDLMRRIIADSPTMQELYDAYNKPVFATQSTMQFQEFRVKRTIPDCMRELDETFETVIELTKIAVAKELFEEIKGYITCEVDTECMTPTITASVFIGRK